MTLWKLVTRSLFHYRKTGGVVVASLAVASAVITGSLVVGASVSGSLREIALSRLGRVEHALVAPRFFRAALARELQSDPALAGRRAVPAILTGGAAANADTDAAIPHVSVIGVGDAFASLFPSVPALRVSEGQAALNESLARDLGLRVGDALLLNLELGGSARSGTLFAQRKRERTIRSVRLDVAAVLPDAGMGSFRLEANPSVPRNLFLPLGWLAREIEEEGRANALLVEPGATADSGKGLQDALASHGTLADHGLDLAPGPLGEMSLYGAEMVLPEAVVRAAREAAAACGMRARAGSINLATAIRAGSGRSIAYALMAGVDSPAPFSFTSGGGKPLDPAGVWLNQWAADDLRARTGDPMEITTLVPASDGSYREEKHSLVLRGIVAMEGLGADPGLVPPIKGVTDADRVDAWEAPFPVDLKRVTPRDEEYWDRYRAAPKAFVALETARDLWLRAVPPGESDWVTSVRFTPGSDAVPPAVLAAAIRSRLSPADAGLAFRPVRRIALDAAQGSTDFGQLFLALSFFLVLSAAGLAGMTMRLLADRRAAETGMLLVCGLRERDVRRATWWEGGVLALAGGLAGVPLGTLYAWILVRALATRWSGALGTSSLSLHVDAISLLAGGISGMAVGVCSAWWGSRQAARRPVLELLAGWQAREVLTSVKPARHPAVLAWILVAVAAGLLVAVGAGALPPSGAFFGSGAALLVAGMLALGVALRRALVRLVGVGVPSPTALALRSAAANPGRSILIAGLYACAAFVLVAVAANKRDVSATDVRRLDSGAGGFTLRAVASLPIGFDFGTPGGRERLGFPPEDEETFRGVTVIPFLASPGDDISCLNPTRPAAPRILGVPAALVSRGGFRVAGPAARGAHPWDALAAPAAGGAIPAFGDADSVMWTLHSGAGKTYRAAVAGGRQADLWFAGLLPGSVFAGELLVLEEHFRRLFPAVGGPRYFLVATPPGAEEKVAGALRRNLGDAGLEVRATSEILTSLKRVQNTYLSAFLALGGIGMLLGTFGLVSALLRSVLERRGELAMMLAMGFEGKTLARILILENAGLLALGLAWGMACALLAVSPALQATGTRVPWLGLIGLLAGMAALGLASCVAAARTAVGDELITALREG